MAKKLSGKLPARPLRYSDEPEQPYWPSFIEKLLLSIIDAHSDASNKARERAGSADRQDRLDTALTALFNSPRRRGNKRLYDLHALVETADATVPSASLAALEEHLSLPKAERTPTLSKRKAVVASAAQTVGISPDARAQRLTRHERKMRNYLSQIALFRSHDEEEDMLSDLHAVGKVLSKWNVPLLVDAEALGMASLWGRNAR